jgi:hypothetical protein
MEASQTQIDGHLDIFTKNNEIFINGDSVGLRSLSNLLLQMANIIEEDDENLNAGDREHISLTPNKDLSKSSDALTIGRLEAKFTGNFYEGYIPRENN